MTPLQKVERRLTSSGCSRLANSELAIVDDFIFSKLGVRPSSQEDRQNKYGDAKSRK